MQAFGITEEDVETVLKENWARVNSQGHTFESMAANLLPQLDHDVIEHSALFGDDLDTQTRYAHEEIERQLSVKLGVMVPRAETMALSDAWFDLHMQGNVPPMIAKASKSICVAHQIKGICDPMYIANVIAFELGAGDGQGHFIQHGSPTILAETLDKIASRVAGSYSSCFAMSAEAVRAELGKAIQYGIAMGAVQSRIEQRPEGWTVVNSQGAIKLRLADGSPAYLPTREEVVEQCRLSGLYEVKAGNPAGLAEGVLVEFLSTRSTDAASQASTEDRQPTNRPRG